MPTLFSAYPLASVMTSMLFLIVIIMMLYAVRHVMFTINRLTGKQRHPYLDIAVARWPMITVFIAAHNEEKVIADCIEALLNPGFLSWTRPSGPLALLPGRRDNAAGYCLPGGATTPDALPVAQSGA